MRFSDNLLFLLGVAMSTVFAQNATETFNTSSPTISLSTLTPSNTPTAGKNSTKPADPGKDIKCYFTEQDQVTVRTANTSTQRCKTFVTKCDGDDKYCSQWQNTMRERVTIATVVAKEVCDNLVQVPGVHEDPYCCDKNLCNDPNAVGKTELGFLAVAAPLILAFM